MATRKQVKKLIKYLEKELDWHVYSKVKKCDNCGGNDFVERYSFCPQCGGDPWEAVSDYDEETEDEFIKALKHAGL